MKTKRKPVFSYILIGIMALLTALLYFLSGQTMQYDLKVGDICPTDIYATRSVVDRLHTEQLRDAAESKVNDQYTVDNSVEQNAKATFQSLIADVRAFRSGTAISDGDIAAFEAKYNYPISRDPVVSLLACSSEQLDIFSKEVNRIRTEVLTEGVTDEIAGEQAAKEKLEESEISPALQVSAATFLEDQISVNKKIDQELTDQEKLKARESVSDIIYQKNQIIARKGEILTENQIAMMGDLGLLLSGSTVNVTHSVGLVLFAALLFLFFILFCEKYQKDILEKRDKVCLFFILYVSTLVLTYVLIQFTEISTYLLPVCIGATLTTVLFDEKTAIVTHTIMCLNLGIFLEAEWDLSILYLLCGFLLIFMFRNTRTQFRIALSALSSCIIFSVGFVLFGLLESVNTQELLYRIPYGILNGLFVTVLTVGILPLLEALFDVLTPTKLADLANPDKRLLKRLLLEAPGTYHHSLTVANLAEEAAEKIGANASLAKVGAYYHDVGKIKNPSLFKENQMYSNPHDNLSPQESASIILAHPVHGLQLAKQHRLPRAVKSIIAEHHGTTSVAYFYHKAVSEEGKENVNIEDFTYEGPVPSSREGAIIMLADSCEAAVRSLEDKTPEGMEKTVRSIISARMEGGQLSGCELTLKDIEIITKSFLGTLSSYFHERIQYPEDQKNV